MKKIIPLIIIAISLIACNSTKDRGSEQKIQPKKEVQLQMQEPGSVEAVMREVPFSKGVNFSAWFETHSAQSINFTRYTEQDFIDLKSLGADVVRVPVRFHSMTSGEPYYTIDPLLLKFLDTAVDWAEKHGLYIIIDNHSFDPVKHTPNDVDKILIPVWEQIARRYRSRSPLVIYEILNEPHGIADTLWGEIQGRTVDAIRRIDPDRLIIVGGTGYNSIQKLSAIPRYTDQNLIYTFHFYDPHVFTHQGAGWGEPSMASLRGVPFPYDRSRMPRVPADLRNTWIAGNLANDYQNAASERTLYRSLDRAVAFANERGVPVFCGEFGVYIPNSENEDRVRWYQFTVSALNNRNIPWTAWDYYGGFGIFKTDRGGDFNYDLNTDVVKALGFTVPEQKVRVYEPVNESKSLYIDYPDREFVTVTYWGDADFSLYESDAYEGEFAIRWGGAPQYTVFAFDFTRNIDFSRLEEEGYFLEFHARAEKKVNQHLRFDVRFLNQESADSIPWRMRFTIDENILPVDGAWHRIQISLSDMNEQGAWINAKSAWLNPEGKFLWEKVARLEFVAEYYDMTGMTVWFDNIGITK